MVWTISRCYPVSRTTKSNLYSQIRHITKISTVTRLLSSRKEINDNISIQAIPLKEFSSDQKARERSNHFESACVIVHALDLKILQMLKIFQCPQRMLMKHLSAALRLSMCAGASLQLKWRACNSRERRSCFNENSLFFVEENDLKFYLLLLFPRSQTSCLPLHSLHLGSL